MTRELAVGAMFAGYRVDAVLGRGGMGAVYRATDLSLDRPVALKVMAPELADDERFRARFLREPRLAASLDHANVVPIYAAGEDAGRLYLVMRFVEGSDLKAVFREGVAPERLLRILAQVAGALDVAHRRGLVHRDVKPGNVLLDADEHAYLTDFGITKQVSGDSGVSTQAGHIVGTLQYIAPEQIRGEAVDGRSDCYSLACVLYEGLTGAPPFAGRSEAETLWAHMQQDPPPLPQPAIDGVLQRALAKEPDRRYPTCTELIEAARGALGLATALPVPRAPLRSWLLRRRHAILAAGLVTLAAAITAGIVVLTTGGGAETVRPLGSGVAALDGGTGKLAALTVIPTAPSNVAVGERAVWVLSAEDRTLSRVDPQTRAVTRRFTMRGVPNDLAAGRGALWIGNGGGRNQGNFTVSVSRVDPRTGAVTHTVRLSDKSGGAFNARFNWGFADIAIGAGAVWARNPDHTISRIDPDTGKLVATIDVDADRVAAGREGVWLLAGSDVVRIDPRTNRLGQRIRIGTQAPTAIAVGAGSIWVTSEQEGVVWRIEPGADPVMRTIDVGVGVTYLAFGAGALWTANYLDGTVARIDPRTNDVTERAPIGAAQSLAAGAGSAWVSTAGGTPAGTLPASACAELVSGGSDPDVLIASDLPLQGDDGPTGRAIADAVRLVLRQHGFRAGKYSVGYRSCDDSTAQTGAFENRRCAANANAYSTAEKLVAVIGPYNSDCAAVEIPILNRAHGGPLAIISPTNTYAGLTRRNGRLPPPDGYRGEPRVYYPTGVRNYVRLLPGDDILAVAQATLARRLGLRGVYVLDDGSNFWKGLLADPFRRAAKTLGVPVSGSARFDASAKSFAPLASKIARSGAQGVLLAGDPFDGADRVLKALRARLGTRLTVMASFLFQPVPEVLDRTGRAAHGVYVATEDLPRPAFGLTPSGRQFAGDLGAAATQYLGAIEAGQAAELVLAAIARSDGSRASVLEELRRSKVTDGILGSFRFDRNGDITTASIPILRITGATPPGTPLPPAFQGAVVDRVVNVPSRLLR